MTCESAAGQRLWVALVHHPVIDRSGGTISTSVTNLDVHDLGRSARTFGAAGLEVVSPIDAQRLVVEHILSYWRDPVHSNRTPGRKEALSIVRVAKDVDEALAHASVEGRAPVLIATSARSDALAGTAPDAPGPRPIGWRELRESIHCDPLTPRLLLLGTGWGLAKGLVARCDLLVDPIAGAGVYNHMSVRSAGAIMLDRLLGRG